MTNGDKIRAMTDEELAVLLAVSSVCMLCSEEKQAYGENCYQRHLAWLKKEVPDGLIDADALKRNMFAYAPPEMILDRDDIEHKIDEMPTIDAVPVVRCEDCKYSEWTSRLDGTKVGYCRRIGNFISPDFLPCRRQGEREDGGEKGTCLRSK